MDRLSREDPAAVQLLELAASLAPEPIPLCLFGDHPELLDEPLRGIAADHDALADTVGELVGYSLAHRSPDGFQVHRLVQGVIRYQLPSDRQSVTAERVMALLAAASPGDPEDPASWAGYAQLAPHVLATCPLGDHDPGCRRLFLDTTRYLQAHGDSSAGRAVGGPLLNRWREVLGPDHPDTLTAASTLTLALIWAGQAEAARVLGEDTLRRCHRALGPDNPITLLAAAAMTHALVGLGEAEAARVLGEDTLRRCHRALGPGHMITLYLTQAASSGHLVLGGDASVDRPDRPQ